MNVWKPIALTLAGALAVTVGTQVAHANRTPDPEPSNMTGECFDQRHMAAAKGYLNSAIGELNQAEHNKGGWRAAALTAANTALARTNEGCAVANGR